MIAPYKVRPVPPRVALLVDERTAIDETGAELELGELGPDVRVWGSHDLVWRLLVDGHGEALCWDGGPIRWRHERLGEREWNRRPSDVSVLRLAFPARVDEQLAGLVSWRDWLADYGAVPNGSLGSAAFSMLRSRLAEPLWIGAGQPPPLRGIIGGRQLLGRLGIGDFPGPLRHWDMPAAYAHTLGHVRYGGWWRHFAGMNDYRPFVNAGMLVFLRARIRVPAELEPGPLPTRPARQHRGWDWLLFPVEYPSGRTVQGLWAWPEIESALEAGCELERVIEGWAHVTRNPDDRPLLPWWRAIEDGRRMRGFAGSLAKASGNALYGQFCIGNGRRTIQRWDAERGEARKRSIKLPPMRGRPRALDLAEYVTASVRGELFRFVNAAGPRLVSAHTDGGWCIDDGWRPKGWRSKARADRLRVINPQLLAYEPHGADETVYVVAGWPPSLAADTFEQSWRELAKVSS